MPNTIMRLFVSSTLLVLGLVAVNVAAFVPMVPSALQTIPSTTTTSLTTTSSVLLHAEPKQQQQPPGRQPWELGRFIQQSSKFVSINPLATPTKQKVQPGDLLWEPSSSSGIRFGPLDDVVMGGVSSSTFDNNSGKWTGTVTDANNGGFVGVRSFPTVQWDMKDCRGIQFKIKQNSSGKRRYKVSIRDSTDFNGIGWTESIDLSGGAAFPNPLLKLFDDNKSSKSQGGNEGNRTSQKSLVVKVPFDTLLPTRFASVVSGQDPLRKDNIVSLQLTYSKFEYDGDLNPNFSTGKIDLQVLEIRAF